MFTSLSLSLYIYIYIHRYTYIMMPCPSQPTFPCAPFALVGRPASHDSIRFGQG